jgi:hypothetical protein
MKGESMSTTPPGETPTSESATPRQRPPFGFVGASGDLARLPVPGNAEFLVLLFVELIFAVLWWFRDDITTEFWMTVTTVLIAFYLLSRGIAKASRVLEQ